MKKTLFIILAVVMVLNACAVSPILVPENEVKPSTTRPPTEGPEATETPEPDNDGDNKQISTSMPESDGGDGEVEDPSVSDMDLYNEYTQVGETWESRGFFSFNAPAGEYIIRLDSSREIKVNSDGGTTVVDLSTYLTAGTHSVEVMQGSDVLGSYFESFSSAPAPSQGNGGGVSDGDMTSCPAPRLKPDGGCCPVDSEWNDLYCEETGNN